MNPVVEEIGRSSMKKKVDRFEVGDTVDVHVRIVEGEKERVQVFTGTVIARRGGGIRESFTVRRVVQGVGVERAFPVHSPKVERVAVKRQGRVRRGKLYYLRRRTGKGTRLGDRYPGGQMAGPADEGAGGAPRAAAGEADETASGGESDA